MIELVFQSGRQQGQTLSLGGSWITLGRAPQCEVVIDDPQASWEHCVVERVPAGFLVTDLGSSNGTFVNDRRLEALEVLTPGDVLRLGNTRIAIMFEATAPLLQADTEVGPAGGGDGALHLLVVAGPQAGASYRVDGEWATVGGEPAHTVHLPGVQGLVAYLVRGEGGYALQPADEGRQDCLLDGAFVQHQALVTQDSILQLGGVSLQAAYGAPDEALNRELSTLSQTPAAAAAPAGPPGLDQTMRLSDADARRLVAEAAARAAEKRASTPQPRAPAAQDETLALKGVTGLHAQLSAYAEARKRQGGGPAVTDWSTVGPGDAVVLDDLAYDAEPPPRHLTLRPRLRCVAGPHMGRVVFLGQGTATIGREEANDVVLFDALVSRQHARVTVEEGRAWIEDLGGRNPLAINGAPPPDGPVGLRHGDLVSLGATVMEFGEAGVDPEKVDLTSTVALPQPRYVFDGQVLVQPVLTVGRNPDADLFLDHDDVDRQHFEIRHRYSVFHLVDTGERGVRVNGTRVVDHALGDGDEISFGGHRATVVLDGFSLTLDLARPRPAVAQEAFALDLTSADPFQTMFRVALPKLPSDQRAMSDAPEAEKAPPRKKIRWVPPGDVQRAWRGPLLVLTGLAFAGCGVAWMANDEAGGRFVQQPVSAPHDTPAFADRAHEALGKAPGCDSCHTAFAGVAIDNCSACHADHAPREAHAKADTVGTDCRGCHVEHPEGEAPAQLLALERCADCHADRHATLKKVTPGPFRLDAKPFAELGAARILALRDAEGTDRLHRIHQAIEHRCVGCHANADQTGEIEAGAATSCLRCHGGVESLEAQPGTACHLEHGDERAASPPAMAAAGGKGPFGAAAAAGPTTGLGLAMLLFAPLFLVLGLHRVVADRARPDEDEAAVDPEPDTPKKLLHIDEEMCVGSRSCVDECPYHVLDIVVTKTGKKVAKVVNFESCNECNTCVEVCQPRALTRRLPGAPVPTVRRAFVDKNYMTSVRGMYLIGEAAGKPLVRNAINLGTRTIEHIRFDGVQPGAAAQAGLQMEVAIVGSGPAGLSAGVTAFERGLTAVVFEKGSEFAQTIRSFHLGKPVQNQPAEVERIGPLWIEDCVREDLLDRWGEHLQKTPVDVRYREGVLKVEPLAGPDEPPRGFKITTSKGEYTALRVILAVGGGEPRPLGRVAGADLDKVRYTCLDPAGHDGEHVCVVGGGNSALEVAIGVAEANNGSNTVRLVYRRDNFAKASKKNVDKLTALVDAGRITLHLNTNPTAVTADSITLEVSAPKGDGKGEAKGDAKGGPAAKKVDPCGGAGGGSSFPAHGLGDGGTYANHYVYCMLGKVAHTRWLEGLGVEFVDKPQGWSPGPSDDLSFLELSGQS